MAEEYFVGNFFVPTLADSLFIPRTYYGIGDPNAQLASYFVPPQRVGDYYIQLEEEDPVTWVYTDAGWILWTTEYDLIPPDNTDSISPSHIENIL